MSLTARWEPSCPPSDAHGTTGCVRTPWTPRNNRTKRYVPPLHGRDGELWSEPRYKTPGPRRPPPRGELGRDPEQDIGSLPCGTPGQDAGSPPFNRGRTCVGTRNRTSGPHLEAERETRIGTPGQNSGSPPRGRGGNSGWNPVGGRDPGQPSFSKSSGPCKPELFSLRALSHALTIFSSFRVLQSVPSDLG